MSRFAELAAAAAERAATLGGMVESIYLSRFEAPPIDAADAARGIQRLDLEHATLRLRIAGDGPHPIVIVPDPPNTLEHYDELIDVLVAGGGVRVICFEVPGFGLSFPRSLTFSFSAEEYTDVLVELLDRLGLGDVTLVMSCIGGYVGLMAARLRPALIRRLVLSQTPSVAHMIRWSRRFDRLGLLGLPVVGQAIMWLVKDAATRFWYSAALPVGADVARYQAPALAAQRLGGPYALASGIQAMRRVDLRELEGVTQPITLIWGHADRTHARTDPRSLLAVVPHARFVSFERSGHFPDLEEPRRFADLVREGV
ncbi:MAG TPA: alpha/beta hydrolase [Kofleriaceae bacterium]|jgi:pimeloyl-ACP methyl ester carboxylesterase